MSETLPLIGSGYRPKAWCKNPGCHAPIDPQSIECPECKALHRPLVWQAVEVQPWLKAQLSAQGLGMIRVWRGGELLERRLYANGHWQLHDALEAR